MESQQEQDGAPLNSYSHSVTVTVAWILYDSNEQFCVLQPLLLSSVSHTCNAVTAYEPYSLL